MPGAPLLAADRPAVMSACRADAGNTYNEGAVPLSVAIDRRTFLIKSSMAAGLAGRVWAGPSGGDETASERSVEAITRGAAQHWFGYYDKQQVDRTGRYALGGQVDTFFRSPTPDPGSSTPTSASSRRRPAATRRR